MFRNSNKYVSRCDDYQIMGKTNKRNEIPLNPQVAWEPFEKYGLNFARPVDNPTNLNIYILTCVDYMTKWVEVKVLKCANEESIA